MEQRYGNSCCLPAKDVIMKCLSAVSPYQYSYYETRLRHVFLGFFLTAFWPFIDTWAAFKATKPMISLVALPQQWQFLKTVHLCRYEENTKHSKYAVMSLLTDCIPIVALFSTSPTVLTQESRFFLTMISVAYCVLPPSCLLYMLECLYCWSNFFLQCLFKPHGRFPGKCQAHTKTKRWRCNL